MVPWLCAPLLAVCSWLAVCSLQFRKHLRVETATVVAFVAAIVCVRNVYHSKVAPEPFPLADHVSLCACVGLEAELNSVGVRQRTGRAGITGAYQDGHTADEIEDRCGQVCKGGPA